MLRRVTDPKSRVATSRGMPMERVHHRRAQACRRTASRRTYEVFRRVIEAKAPISYENIDWNRADQVSEVTLIPVFDAAGQLHARPAVIARHLGPQAGGGFASAARLRDDERAVRRADARRVSVASSSRTRRRVRCSAQTARGVAARAGSMNSMRRVLFRTGRRWSRSASSRANTASRSTASRCHGSRHPLELSIAFLAYARTGSVVRVRPRHRRATARRDHAPHARGRAVSRAEDGSRSARSPAASRTTSTTSSPRSSATRRWRRSTCQPNHPGRQDIAEVLRATRRARELVSQILTFSRKQQPERRPVRVADVVDDVLRLLRATIPSTIELRSEIARLRSCTFSASRRSCTRC